MASNWISLGGSPTSIINMDHVAHVVFQGTQQDFIALVYFTTDASGARFITLQDNDAKVLREWFLNHTTGSAEPGIAPPPNIDHGLVY